MANDHLILYDGVCGLCNRLNTFLLPRDEHRLFQFASIQSAFGQAILKRFGRNPLDLDTFFVIANHRSPSPQLLDQARAALFVLQTLGGPWSWVTVLRVLPVRLLNWGYDRIARNRYRVFGRHESCLLPTAKYKDRFIDV